MSITHDLKVMGLQLPSRANGSRLRPLNPDRHWPKVALHHGVIDNTPYGKVYSVVTVYNAIQSAMLEYILRNTKSFMCYNLIYTFQGTKSAFGEQHAQRFSLVLLLSIL